jgi:hypothetical protein
VPPVKSTPKFNPLVTRNRIEAINIEVEIIAEIFLNFIKGISVFTLKISII